ncbi:Protein of unknown function [Thermobacillus xylanilyticus]|nr:Protein of unknown function [Thermobacillus xylanilyticus]
MSVRGG